MAEATRARQLPAGLIVHGDPAELAGVFPALVPLQPVRWTDAGLACAPRVAPELAGPALARCPLPCSALRQPPGWPSPAAAMVAGWYRRSPGHAPAPPGTRELVQSDGEGFGPIGHPTTAMCLAAIPEAPAAPALDAGCGSGLLAQGWARHHRQSVLALDADPRAVRHCARSLVAAGLADLVAARRGQVSQLNPEELVGRVILANLPVAGQREILARLVEPPRAAIISGLDRVGLAEIAAGYARLGLRARGGRRRARWHQLTMVL